MPRSHRTSPPGQSARAAVPSLAPTPAGALLAALLVAALALAGLPAWADEPPAAAQAQAMSSQPRAEPAQGPGADAAQAAPEVPRVTEVRVLPRVEVPGAEFTLGEVAEFDGPELATLQRLAAVSLGRSPLPGRSLRLNEPYLRARLNPILSGNAIVLKVPADAEVVRASQVVPGSEIGAKVLALAAEQAVSTRGELEQQLAVPIPDAVLPTGQVDWQIEPLGRHLAAGGTRTFRVVARVQGEEFYRSLARVEQQVFADVVVAMRPVRRNDVIRAVDVIVERKPVSGMKAESYLTRAAEAVGARAKRPIGQGEWINKDMVVGVADVPEGGPVQLVYQTEAVLFTTPGVALVPAKLGAFIPVRNLESGKIVYGVVQSHETVKVN